MVQRPGPATRRVIIAVPFLAALVLAMRLDRGPSRAVADLARPGFMLRDETSSAGIHFVHRRPSFDPRIAGIEPHVAALGASVSVADFDGDGRADLYFTNSRFGEPGALYHNRGDGTFEEIAADAGLADISREGDGVAMGSVWGDFDNDGREDVLVYRYGYLALFKNVDGHRFVDVTARAGLRRWVNSNGAIWLDYDRDGLLDLYVTAYFRDIDLWHLATTKIMHNSFEFASNGGKNLLFHNLGDGKFEDVTDRMGVGSTRWTLAAASADFNGDFWPDIYLANDYGPEELYLNDRGRRFVLTTTAGLESESKSGMSVSLGDAFNRGRLDAFVTNISERGYVFQNNNLRLNEMAERGRFRNIAEGEIADAGWAWGAQFGDLDNDGANELFVVNGFISADRTSSYWYSMSKIAGANARFFEDAATWPPFGNASLSGYERSRVYLNRGVAGWIDVAKNVGVSDLYDGRAVALADLSNRGAMDVIVANQNQPAVLYRNYPERANHWIAFKLIGNRSNRSAIGAEVVLESGDLTQRRVVDGGSGFASQNDRRLHFGLGSREWVDRIVIYWPSGARQVVLQPPIDGVVTVTEARR